MRWFGAVVFCTGCFSSAFEVERHAFASRTREGSSVYVGDHLIDRSGTLTFVRGTRRSPRVLAASLIVGAEGVCVPSYYDVARFWLAVRVDEIDLRIENLVVPEVGGVTVTRVAERTWEARGANEALRAWIQHHMYRREKALRAFIDLPTMTYSVSTPLGWRTIDQPTLERLAARPDIRGEQKSRVGWKWSDFDRVRYARLWPDRTPTDQEVAEAIDGADREVRGAIGEASGLAPGPCPLLDAGKLLLDE